MNNIEKHKGCSDIPNLGEIVCEELPDHKGKYKAWRFMKASYFINPEPGNYLVKRTIPVWTSSGTIQKSDWIVTTWTGSKFTCAGTVVEFLNKKLS